MPLTEEQQLDLNSGITAFEAKHFQNAMQMLRPLAELGEPEAQYRVAMMMINGLHGLPTPEEGGRYLELAAEQGHAMAMHGVGFMYYEGEGKEKDLSKAAEWFNKAAALGLSGSMVTLAMMYQEGNGVEQDLDEARRLYTAAGFEPSEMGL